MPKPRSIVGDPEREEIAARLVATAQGHLNVPDAMRIVKISTPVRSNDTVRKRVMRRAKKLEAEARDNGGDVAVMIPVQEVETSNPSSTNTGELSSITGASTVASPSQNLDEIRRNLADGPSEEGSTTTSTTKQQRRTSKQVQRDNATQMRAKKLNALGMKSATKRIQQNKFLSPSKRKSQRAIVEEINGIVGSNLNSKTVSRMVRQGYVGVSPLKRGPTGNFPKKVWDAMRRAYVTFVKLEGAQCKYQSTMNDLSKRVNALVNQAGFNKKGLEVVRKLRKETADELDVATKNVVEQRRVQWTTHNNISVWFDSWEDTLVELGFARLKTVNDPERIEGSLFFFRGQRRRILNFDETDGSLDNTSGHQRGGRPPIVFTAAGTKRGATHGNKSSYCPTIICGSNSDGEALPPHFQLRTLAQTTTGQRLSVDFIGNCKSVQGQFGFPSPRLLDCTFGMNEKGGMNSVELQKYIMKAILPLYPDIADIPTKRVICKVDSGPGRTNAEMLAELKLRGFYLFPGVPNTTSVTQETDQNYGPFKTYYRQNIEALSQEKFQEKKTLGITELPLLVFGREQAGEGSSRELRDAFSLAFSRELCLSSWRKCGSVPLTRSALRSDKVMHQIMHNVDGTIDAKSDPATQDLLNLEECNHFACDYLSTLGYDGSQLRIDAPRKKKAPPLTQPFTLERQEAILKAKSAGQLFHATGGTMLNSDDMFRARALSQRKKEIDELETKLKFTKKRSNIKVQALTIRTKQGRGDLTLANHKQFTATEVKTLLQWKLGKTSGKKEELIKRYIETPRPVEGIEFSCQDGRRLTELKNPNNLIPLSETALGVAAKQNANAVINNMDELQDAEIKMLFEALSKKFNGQPKDDNDYEDGHDQPPQPI